jgi:hypothetical protein
VGINNNYINDEDRNKWKPSKILIKFLVEIPLKSKPGLKKLLNNKIYGLGFVFGISPSFITKVLNRLGKIYQIKQNFISL